MWRTIFVSDLHIGNRRFKARALLKFLDNKNIDAQTIVYLVGDIFDDLAPDYWPDSHRDVIAKLLRHKLIYIPGNHDAWARNLAGILSPAIQLVEECVYQASNGKRYLLTHGDFYDYSIKFVVKWGPRWLRRQISDALSHWHDGSHALTVENKIFELVKRMKLDGVICGHTHRPDHRAAEQIEYLNCGDWLKHMTCVADDGNNLRLVWAAVE